MQIPKPFLFLCTTVIATAPLSLHADDTDAQIKAREALEKKMQELQSQAPQTTRRAPVPARAAKPLAPPAAAPGVLPTDSEAVARAREALEQKMKQLQSQPPQAPRPAPVPAVLQQKKAPPTP